MSKSTLNRRTVLKAMGTAPILAAAPQAVRAMNESDVIVIGAGLSGLNAALMLQGEGLDVRVLEGRNRIGGRMQSLRNVPGNPEVGGTSFAPGYARLVDACNTYGVGLIDLTAIVPYFYQRELILNGEVISPEQWPTSPLNPFPADSKEMMPWSILGAFMAKNNPLQYADAWIDPKNAQYDISYYDWLKQLERCLHRPRLQHKPNSWDERLRSVCTHDDVFRCIFWRTATNRALLRRCHGVYRERRQPKHSRSHGECAKA